MITNRDIKRVSRQVFSSSRTMITPFYNRTASKLEVESIFAERAALQGSAVVISAPMGTGKTFFIDQVAQQVGILGRERPLLVRELTKRDLDREKSDVVFVDEGDIKTDWVRLTRGMEVLGRFLKSSGRVAVLLGDLVLRNPEMLGHLPSHRFVNKFEPLDSSFLRGVIRQRLEEYLKANHGEEIIEPSLYEILVPDGTAHVNSFRTILSALERLVGTLTYNNAVCSLTLDMAIQHEKEKFDPVFHSDRQAAFLNSFLDHLAECHPRGSGLEYGIDTNQMFELASRVGYGDWASFQDEIVDPFGEQGLLLSRGIPGLDAHGRFARWVEPYYPSLSLMLVAEQ